MMVVNCQCLWLVQQEGFPSLEINKCIVLRGGYGESQWPGACLEEEQQIWINQLSLSPLGSRMRVHPYHQAPSSLDVRIFLSLAQTNFNSYFSTRPFCWGQAYRLFSPNCFHLYLESKAYPFLSCLKLLAVKAKFRTASSTRYADSSTQGDLALPPLYSPIPHGAHIPGWHWVFPKVFLCVRSILETELQSQTVFGFTKPWGQGQLVGSTW